MGLGETGPALARLLVDLCVYRPRCALGPGRQHGASYMDVQAIGQTTKSTQAAQSTGAGNGAPADSGDAVSAFSAVLHLVGANFSNTLNLPTLETKLMHSDD